MRAPTHILSFAVSAGPGWCGRAVRARGLPLATRKRHPPGDTDAIARGRLAAARAHARRRPTRACPQADEPVDPKPKIEAECHKACTKEWAEYEKCKDRIKAKGTGSCEPWAFDYWKCIDKCVSGLRHAGRGGAPLLQGDAVVLRRAALGPGADRSAAPACLAAQTAPKLFALLK